MESKGSTPGVVVEIGDIRDRVDGMIVQAMRRGRVDTGVLGSARLALSVLLGEDSEDRPLNALRAAMRLHDLEMRRNGCSLIRSRRYKRS